MTAQRVRGIRGTLRSITTWAETHPVFTTTVISVLVSALHFWWLDVHRHLGSLNPDEANFGATAARLAGALESGEWANLTRDLRAGPPAVPLVGAAGLLVAPGSANAPMVAQLASYILAAVAAAGCVRTLAGDRPALLAGIVSLSLPAVLISTRYLNFALMAAAMLIAGLWALFASDRGRRRIPMILFGLAIGVMVISRSMTISLLPAVAAVVGIEVERRSRALANVALAAVAGVLVAGPWWWVQGSVTLDSMLSHGYGERSVQFGDRSVVANIPARASAILGMAGWPLAIVGIGVVIGYGLQRRRRAAVASRPWTTGRRRRVALVVVVLWGYLALVSTRNNGWFFELPLAFPVVAGVIAAADSLPARLRGRAASLVGALCAVMLVASLVDPGGRLRDSSVEGVIRAVGYPGYASHSHQMGEADPRLIGTPAQRAAAARQWWAASTETVRRMDAAAPDRWFVYTVVGGYNAAINPATVNLASELRPGDPPPLTGALGDEDDATLRYLLEPGERVIAVLLARTAQYWGRAETAHVLEFARDMGWRTVDTMALPDGGRVEILAFPDDN